MVVIARQGRVFDRDAELAGFVKFFQGHRIKIAGQYPLPAFGAIDDADPVQLPDHPLDLAVAEHRFQMQDGFAVQSVAFAAAFHKPPEDSDQAIELESRRQALVKSDSAEANEAPSSTEHQPKYTHSRKIGTNAICP